MTGNQQNSNHEDSLRRYQVFLDERKQLLATAKEAAIQYAKAIMTLSAGALTLSLAFMKDIVPNPGAGTLLLLKGSWLSFSLSLISVVISFLLSEFAFIRQVEISQKSLSIDPTKSEAASATENPYKRWIIFLNIVSLAAFIMGVILLVLFSLFNLKVK